MPNAAAAEDLAVAFADVRSRRQGKETIRRPRVYEPLPGDYVVGRVEERNAEGYKVKLMGAAVPGVLGAVAFDGATKRTRPHLNIDDLVYCRVLRVPRGGEAELTCCAPPKGPRREWTTGAATFGPLPSNEALIAVVPPQFAELLLERDAPVLKALAQYIAYEVAIGLNGRVWCRAATFGPLPASEALVAVVPPQFAELLLERDAPVLKALAQYIAFEVAIGLNGRVWCRASTLGDAIVVANALENAAFLEANAVASMVTQVINAMRAKTASQGGYAQAVSGDNPVT